MNRRRIHRYELDGVACGFCNYRTHDHYVIASSREEADELMEEAAGENDKQGFCAGCLIDEIINDRRNGDRPKLELIEADVGDEVEEGDEIRFDTQTEPAVIDSGRVVGVRDDELDVEVARDGCHITINRDDVRGILN